MIPIKDKLAKNGKKAIDFISYICDKTRNLNLKKYKGKDMVRITRNGKEGEIYIDRELGPVLDKFLEDECCI